MASSNGCRHRNQLTDEEFCRTRLSTSSNGIMGTRRNADGAGLPDFSKLKGQFFPKKVSLLQHPDDHRLDTSLIFLIFYAC